jgi:hypothetical protein
MPKERSIEHCCMCGKPLPNRYAVAGRCEDGDGCQAPFCPLCWRGGDQRCPAHGGKRRNVAMAPVPAPTDTPPLIDPEEPEETQMKTSDETQAINAKPLGKEKAKKVMKWAVDAVVRLGKGAVGLAARLKKDRSPEAMLTTLDETQEALRPRRESLAAELETLYNQIAKGKQALAKAAPARRRIIEAELKAQLAAYQGLERQYGILLENERHVHAVRNRLHEMTLYGMATVDEKLVESLTDDIEDAVADAEDRDDLVRDLEKAGKRRERDGDSLLDQLGDFELPAEETDAPALADDFELPAPPVRRQEGSAARGEADGIPQ